MNAIISVLAFIIQITSITVAILATWIILKKIRSRGIATTIFGEKLDHQTYFLNTSEKKEMLESLSSLVNMLNNNFKEFSDEVNDYSEYIQHEKVENKFKQVCYDFAQEMGEILDKKGIYLRANFRQDLTIVKDSLKSSIKTTKKEPIVKVFLEYKLELPIRDEPFEGSWEGEVIERHWFFPFEEGTYRLPGIDLTYSKIRLEAQVTSKRFKDFLYCKIGKLQKEIANELFVQKQEEKVMSGDRIINITGGNYVESNSGTYVQGNYINMSQDLTQAASQIHDLIEQLKKTGVTVDVAQKGVAKDMATQAQNNPTIKEKLLKWGQSLGDAMVSDVVKGTVKLAIRSAGIPLP